MEIPLEFKNMALRMHQDLPEFISMTSENEIAEYLAGGVGVEERGPIVIFLDRVLASDLEPDDLARMWVEAGADWFVSSKGIIRFLTMLRDELKSSLV